MEAVNSGAELRSAQAPVTEHSLPGSSTVVGHRPDGKLAGYAVIWDPSAPQEFRFKVSAGGKPVTLWKSLENAEAGVLVVQDGATIATIEAPWAKDKTGRAVETEYLIEGDVLVQKVRHQGSSYPVVADPTVDWGGAWLVVNFNRSETTQIGWGGAAGLGVAVNYCNKVPHPIAKTACIGEAAVIAAVGAAAAGTDNQFLRVTIAIAPFATVFPWYSTC